MHEDNLFEGPPSVEPKERYYKAVTPAGTDFYSGLIPYVRHLEEKTTLVHKNKGDRTRPMYNSDPSTFFSVSTVPSDCTGMKWPARLLEVEIIGEVMGPGYEQRFKNRRGAQELKVVRELDPVEFFGKDADRVRRMVDRAKNLTDEEKKKLTEYWQNQGYVSTTTLEVAAKQANANPLYAAISRTPATFLGLGLDGYSDPAPVMTAIWGVVLREHLTAQMFAKAYAGWAQVDPSTEFIVVPMHEPIDEELLVRVFEDNGYFLAGVPYDMTSASLQEMRKANAKRIAYSYDKALRNKQRYG